MTSDAFRDVFPVAIDFSPAELLTDTKMDLLATNIDTGLATMSKAVGDVWGDEFASNPLFRHQDRPANIVNLARAIGPMSMLNPIRPGRDKEFTVTFSPGSLITEGDNVFALPFPPLKITETGEYGISYAINNSKTDGDAIYDALHAIDAAVFVEPKSSKADVDAAGDYFIDNNGYVYTFSPCGDYAAVGDQTYKTYVYPDTYDKARMNVIPDWGETTTLCTVTDEGAYYSVVLPTIDTFPVYSSDGNPLTSGTVLTTPTSYQAELPYAVVEEFDGGAVPDGIIQLWDDTAGEMIDGLSFTMQNSYTLQVTGQTLVASTNRYRVVTFGATIAETIGYLKYHLFNHNHDFGYGYLSSIKHDTVKDLTIPGTEIDSIWSVTASSPPSVIEGNDHPQYLCRYGWCSGNEDAGQYDNAMLGDLFMAIATDDYPTDGYTDGATDSRKIYFSNTNRYLFLDASEWGGSGGIMAHGPLGTDSSFKAASYIGAGEGSDDGRIYFGTSSNNNILYYDDTYSALGLEVGNAIGSSNFQAGSFHIHLASDPVDASSPPSSEPYISATVPSGGGGTYDPIIKLQTGDDAIYGTIKMNESSSYMQIVSTHGIYLTSSSETININGDDGVNIDSTAGDIDIETSSVTGDINLTAPADITLEAGTGITLDATSIACASGSTFSTVNAAFNKCCRKEIQGDGSTTYANLELTWPSAPANHWGIAYDPGDNQHFFCFHDGTNWHAMALGMPLTP